MTALVHHQKGLEIKLKLLGRDHPLVVTSCSNIGVVYSLMGDLENALVQHQKALEIRTRAFGSDHLSVAASYNNIAIIYRKQGKYKEALEYYQKDLDITVRLVGGATTRTWRRRTTTLVWFTTAKASTRRRWKYTRNRSISRPAS